MSGSLGARIVILSKGLRETRSNGVVSLVSEKSANVFVIRIAAPRTPRPAISSSSATAYIPRAVSKHENPNKRILALV